MFERENSTNLSIDEAAHGDTDFHCIVQGVQEERVHQNGIAGNEENDAAGIQHSILIRLAGIFTRKDTHTHKWSDHFHSFRDRSPLLLYRKYKSNLPNSIGWPSRKTKSLTTQIPVSSTYSRQNVRKTATINDGFGEFVCLLHLLKDPTAMLAARFG